ncbi:MAG: hypothetical protein KAT68_02995 [Bacteroidales bacterium]|nr:hypothetical protein [Bacteroidales bacterium]
MSNTIPLEYEKYYHIYNRGINGCELFRKKADYEYFFRLYDKYILLVADIFAWVLMGNHFHFLVRIKSKNEIGYLLPLNNQNSSVSSDYGRFLATKKWKTEIPNKGLGRANKNENTGKENLKKPVPHRQFAHLFNSYSKYYNNKYNRTGSLFEKNFKRISIEKENYLRYLIYYIHHNPIHHGFVENMNKYPWSSYLTIVSPTQTRLKRKEVIEWFDNIENLCFFHKQQHEMDSIKDYLIDY